MLKITYTLRLGQLLKITLDLKKYMWQKLKPKKPNITIKHILEPNLATKVEPHFQLDITIIEVNNQMAII